MKFTFDSNIVELCDGTASTLHGELNSNTSLDIIKLATKSINYLMSSDTTIEFGTYYFRFEIVRLSSYKFAINHGVTTVRKSSIKAVVEYLHDTLIDFLLADMNETPETKTEPEPEIEVGATLISNDTQSEYTCTSIEIKLDHIIYFLNCNHGSDISVGFYDLNDFTIVSKKPLENKIPTVKRFDRITITINTDTLVKCIVMYSNQDFILCINGDDNRVKIDRESMELITSGGIYKINSITKEVTKC